jgi:hypothetical protein
MLRLPWLFRSKHGKFQAYLPLGDQYFLRHMGPPQIVTDES